MGDNWGIPHCFDDMIASKIIATVINTHRESHSWLGSPNPTARKFHAHLFATHPTVPWHNLIWHRKCALRFSAYAWMAFKRGLKMFDVLLSRGIPISNKCYFCDFEQEYIAHMYFECSFTFSIIKHFLPWLGNRLMRPNLYQALDSVLDQGLVAPRANFHLLNACATIYFIWRAQNDRIFGIIVDCQATVIAKIINAIARKTSSWKDL